MFGCHVKTCGLFIVAQIGRILNVLNTEQLTVLKIMVLSSVLRVKVFFNLENFFTYLNSEKIENEILAFYSEQNSIEASSEVRETSKVIRAISHTSVAQK